MINVKEYHAVLKRKRWFSDDTTDIFPNFNFMFVNENHKKNHGIPISNALAKNHTESTHCETRSNQDTSICAMKKYGKP